jgi:hypothetical protein
LLPNPDDDQAYTDKNGELRCGIATAVLFGAKDGLNAVEGGSVPGFEYFVPNPADDQG